MQNRYDTRNEVKIGGETYKMGDDVYLKADDSVCLGSISAIDFEAAKFELCNEGETANDIAYVALHKAGFEGVSASDACDRDDADEEDDINSYLLEVPFAAVD